MEAENSKTKKLPKETKIAIIAVLSVIVLIFAGGGIYCAVTEKSPSQAIRTIFPTNEDRLVGKWQSQKNPGVNAFVFYEDGKYDSYISTLNFSGRYMVDGNELILTNPSTSKDIVYKFKATDKELSLTLIEEDGVAAEDKEESVYDRVDELNQKTFSDLIGEYAQANKETTDAQ